jgi:hypothetical protein
MNYSVKISSKRLDRVCFHVDKWMLGEYRFEDIYDISEDPTNLVAYAYHSMMMVCPPSYGKEYTFVIGDSSTGCVRVMPPWTHQENHDLGEVGTRRRAAITEKFDPNSWNTVFVESLNMDNNTLVRSHIEWGKNICIMAYKKSMWEELERLAIFRGKGDKIPHLFLRYVERTGLSKSSRLTDVVTRDEFARTFDAIVSRTTCDMCKVHVDQVASFKKCPICWKARYCSKECQRADWKDHKGSCVRTSRTSQTSQTSRTSRTSRTSQ